MGLREQVAEHPRGFYYVDTLGRPRWGDKRSAKRDEVEASRARLVRLMSPQDADAAGLAWPAYYAARPVAEEHPAAPPAEEHPTPPPAEERPAEERPPVAHEVPDYDAMGAELGEDPGASSTADPDADELPAMLADPKLVAEFAGFASDMVLDLLIMATYIGSPVGAEERQMPTADERRMWRRAVEAYAAEMAGDIELTPGVVLLGTAATIAAPRLAHAQGPRLVALLSKRAS